MTGFINVNKEAGVSSAREVSIVKRLTHCPCGHMGTLDPMAQGVLPVAIGNACRLFDYLLTKRKTYVADFIFGESYDTLDVTGNLTGSGGRVPEEEEILSVIPSLVGEVMQVPPRYSAKSVNGKRGYMLAREGVEFTLPPKKVSIFDIKLLKRKDDRTFSFEICCGGGTYIRSIVRDMAQSLKTLGAMSALIRTASGYFKIENSVETGTLTDKNVEDFIIPCDSVIEYESVKIYGAEQKKLLNGVAVKSNLTDGIYKLYTEDGVFYGLAQVSDGIMKVRTKLC